MRYVIFFFILFICACKKQKVDDVEYIPIALNNDIINASFFISEASVVKLETNDDCLIQRISKIQFIDNKLYILDIDHNSLLIFNKDGSFDKKLAKFGGGPGEYIRILDFYIQDSLLYMMDFSTRSILKYDLNLAYLGKYRYNTMGFQFIVKDDVFWIYNMPATSKRDDYQFICLNQKNRMLNQCLPRRFLNHPYNNHWENVNVFATGKENVYASPQFGNVIYAIKENDLLPVYEIKFDKRNFPENENINDYDISSYGFNYMIKHSYYLSEKYFIFEFFIDNVRHFCFYDPNNKQATSGIVKNDLIKDFRFFPRWGNGNYLIEEVASYHITEDFMFLSNYNEQLKDIQEDDNSVIIIYTLKTRTCT